MSWATTPAPTPAPATSCSRPATPWRATTWTAWPPTSTWPQKIATRVGVTPRTFAHPCGQSFVGRGAQRASSVPLVAERFVAGRGYLGKTANDPDHCDLAHIEPMPMDGLSGDELDGVVDRALAEDDGRGRWLVLAGHDIADGGDQAVPTSSLDHLGRQRRAGKG